MLFQISEEEYSQFILQIFIGHLLFVGRWGPNDERDDTAPALLELRNSIKAASMGWRYGSSSRAST
jgi:hypothetical protein